MHNVRTECSRNRDSHLALEQAVIQLWVEVLGLDHIPRTDATFFEAGGHSIYS